MRYSVLLALMMFAANLASIEVGGHISSNSTWSPDNNPYIVTHNIYVDSTVDLTILPGTVIQFHAAAVSYDTYSYDFLIHPGGDSNAKMMYIFGRVIAIGTVQDSITFTRYEETPDNMRWGNIVFDENAPQSVFKHCRLLYSFASLNSLTWLLEGTMCCMNGKIEISDCRFSDYRTAIWIDDIQEPLLIQRNVFQQYAFSPDGWCPTGFWTVSPNNGAEIILAYNQFYGFGTPCDFASSPPLSYPMTMLFNYLYLTLQVSRDEGNLSRTVTAGDSFGNQVINSAASGLGAFTVGENYKAYIRRNILSGSNGISAFGHVEISDNVLTDCNRIQAEDDSNTDIFNNRLKNTLIFHNGAGKIFNNVITDFGYPGAYNISMGITYLSNNIAYNGISYPVNYYDAPLTTIIENNIFLNVHVLNHYPFTYATFRNNYMSIPLPNQCIDGGGNIIGSNPLFTDQINGDFHLLPGSPCIDAGYDTTGYNTMDFDYYHRMVDGNNDGIDRIDIGAFEYNSYYTGGFTGHLYQAPGVPLALAKVDIAGAIISREYTDSTGFFTFNAPPGDYTLHIHHIFKGDREYNIHIDDNQVTVSNLYWEPVGIDDDAINPSIPSLELVNYPNPFSQETNIGFSVNKAGMASCRVYNTRGQLVKTIVNGKLTKGYQTYIWDGRDESSRQAANGIYFLKVETDGNYAVHKMLKLR